FQTIIKTENGLYIYIVSIILLYSEKHPGYTFCWDNIGRHLTVRQQTTDHQNKYHMWALAYAAVNRVQTTDLPIDDFIPASTIPLKSYLPSDEDTIDLKNRLIFEVESIAAEYLQAFKPHSPKPFAHQHTAVLEKKSHLINLGIIQENPSSTAGTIAILGKLHKYVPITNEKLNACVVYGDGLTCERHNDAHNARAGGRTAEDRLEGLEPCPQEFHKRMLILQDTWNEFFDGNSCTEKGTLYNIKNAFNHRSVGKDVSKCFNHAVDLLNHVTDSFTLLLLMQLMQINGIEEIPSNFPNTSSAQKVYLHQKATQLIETIWHNCGTECIDPAEIPRDDNSQICNCKDELEDTIVQCTNSFCTTRYFHQSCVAPDTNTPLDSPWFCSDLCQAEAGMYRFCTCKKDRGLDIDMIGCDNHSCSNGTWFHIDCVKIDKIPGVNGFLPTKLRQDMIWNRTVNYTGGRGSNLEMDLVNEFLNKDFINSLHMTGKMTDETIDRHGKIVGGLKTEINSIYDTMTGQRTWHAVGGCNRRRTDVIKLISHLQKEDLFNYHGGRTYKSFKKFTLKSCNSIGSMLTKIERLSKKLDRRKRIL
ncbi:uncharacterized protein, partial [Mytilus edulis]|uniref:uncharacterized protein n=1 Tax=Mytilus edulis TaxID=6550 RepID=UPI0039EFE441